MKIFIAGATGTLGRPVVRLLLAHGHEVVGLTRTVKGQDSLQRAGAQGVVGNALYRDELERIMTAARPDQVVHLLTALPPGGPMRPRHLEATNELRTIGTGNLLAAAINAGAGRLVAESFVGVYGLPSEGVVLSEDSSLPPVPNRQVKDTVLALRAMEDQLRAAKGIETVTLRIGYLYGPDVPSIEQLVAQAKRGRLFVPRGMSGIGPFVEISDAAAAIVAAIERPVPSAVYNIVDDEPVALATFLTRMTRAIGAPPPRELPAWIVKLMAPIMAEGGTAKLILSNTKAKRELAWLPRYPTSSAGLAHLAAALAEAA